MQPMTLTATITVSTLSEISDLRSHPCAPPLHSLCLKEPGSSIEALGELLPLQQITSWILQLSLLFDSASILSDNQKTRMESR